MTRKEDKGDQPSGGEATWTNTGATRYLCREWFKDVPRRGMAFATNAVGGTQAVWAKERQNEYL